jgi:hypothetical protein
MVRFALCRIFVQPQRGEDRPFVLARTMTAAGIREAWIAVNPTGFRWNFYGFFVFAAVWVALYFVWAFFKNRSSK